MIEAIKNWERRRLRSRVVRALTLAPRGAVVGDGLLLRSVSPSLAVEWYARDVHPWDSDLPAERRAELFTAGVTADTVVAIQQMFERLAEIDVIEIRVLEPNQPHQTILTGTICREDLRCTPDCQSPTMNLKLLGINYELAR